MPFLRIVLLSLLPLAANAGDLKLKTGGWKLRHALQALEPRTAPPVGKTHLARTPPVEENKCVFVAGVRHCPLPPLPRD
jgi:hypothetical protein